ncbi:hypothetical protein [Botrimarina hoheduenensis]|uniref:Uncharacterized protein n=1 Tax=Botrimarina hoheduenensis TaxID=2528000 RepID=A0A5C5WDV6_9BACT|nr:hypothetical protein [Botrimarina hoheduenensis]TWT48894.1 hypothetical protein Pla111_06700 [Botrimarina hoheduenensis]
MFASIFGWLLTIGLAAGAAWWWLRRGAALRRRAAREAAQAAARFLADAALLADRFLAVASRGGKPRGLIWKACRFQAPRPLLARDTATGELYALAAVDITFDAIAGGDMEEVAAVSDIRGATAVFVWRADRWDTDGRVVFNLEPEETLLRFGNALVRCETAHD